MFGGEARSGSPSSPPSLPPPASPPIEALQRGGWKQRKASPLGRWVGGDLPFPVFERWQTRGWSSEEVVFRKVMAHWKVTAWAAVPEVEDV